MQHEPKTIEQRLRGVLRRIEREIYKDPRPLALEALHCAGEPIAPEVAFSGRYLPISLGGEWGPMWGTTWFRAKGKIPGEWRGKRVVARVGFSYDNIEGFTVEALIFQGGLPKGAINVHRDEIVLAEKARAGAPFEFHLEAAANPSCNYPHLQVCRDTDLMPGSSDRLFGRLERAEIAWFDAAVFDLFHDFRMALDSIAALSRDSARRGRVVRALHLAANAWDNTPGGAGARSARRILAPLFAARNGDSQVRVTAVGHAHIDTAWLWPLRESVRKCARTFSMQLAYMDRYPDFTFSCSQAVHYAWMKHRYPSIFREIVRKIRERQWEVVGSMWVEPDCNLPSGESIVRQIVHGKGFFLREFGVETRDLWLPDVFGYAAGMPQILKQAGVDYFFTTKISWNQTNRFPHRSFVWEGIDGSRVLAHFTPADNYRGTFEAEQVVKCERANPQSDRTGDALYVHGWGDGGGGPTIQHIESARRMQDFEGIPPVRMGHVKRFFETLEAGAEELPVWVGELYLELHRGTYTSQAFIKRANRSLEFGLREVEFLFAACETVPGLVRAAQLALKKTPAPQAAVYDEFGTNAATPIESRLERAWRLLLLNQFHDIIPGSSIHWVYEDARKDAGVVEQLIGQVRETLIAELARRLDIGDAKEPLMILNSLGHDRCEVVEFPGMGPRWVKVPAMGWRVVDAAQPDTCPHESVNVSAERDTFIVENGLIRVEVDPAGRIRKLTDIEHGRELFADDKPGNIFTLHADRPLFWDAWDVETYADEMATALDGRARVRIEESGSLRSSVSVQRRFGGSSISQRIVLRAGSRRVDFETEVDWHETQTLLRVCFPLELRAHQVRREVQFGHVETSTHRNTSWDTARFEVCAHKWIDIEEGGYGVAVLNDCKYGHSVEGAVVRLSLLRSPVWPDPMADRGKHRFTYSLLPHSGTFIEAGVVREAYQLNSPLRLVPVEPAQGRKPAPAEFRGCSVDSRALVIEAFKPAEDGSGDTIIRLYEAHKSRGRARLRFSRPLLEVQRVDLLERPQPEKIDRDGEEVCLDYRPFEIISLRLKFATD